MFDINPVNLYFEMELDVIHFFICFKSTLLNSSTGPWRLIGMPSSSSTKSQVGYRMCAADQVLHLQNHPLVGGI